MNANALLDGRYPVSYTHLDVYTRQKHGTGKRIMLAAHMDQIGFVVTSADENGFLRIHQLGGIARNVTLGRRVVFENGVEGVIYFEQTSEGGAYDVDMSRMFIDIGASTREEALSRVSIGDAATYLSLIPI